MSSRWDSLLPNQDDLREDALRRLEHTATQHIMSKSGFTAIDVRAMQNESHLQLLTFNNLVMLAGFPLVLCPAVFKAAQIKDFDKDLELRPEKTPLFKQFDQYAVSASHDDGHSFGIVFKWTYRGKFHVLHNAAHIMSLDAGCGRWWSHTKGDPIFLQSIDSLLAVLGQPDEW